MPRGSGSNGTPYTRHEVIGRGSYGIVYKGVHNESRATVAIKVLNLDTAEDEVADIQKEIVLLQALKAGDAQNVVKYHGSFLNGTRLWIIMDYCEGGSIRTLMKSGRIEEKYILVIIREVLAALAYIHKSDIIHRDVKAANVLVTNDGRVQLCDFGVAAQLAANHFKRNTFVGTPYWMAPEVISDGLSYNFKADIWSLGITIYEIATGNPPYADQEPMRAIFLIPRSAPTRLEGNFSVQLKEFVAACLSERPEDRPTAPELLKMKYIKNSTKTSTLILRELIARYETWRKSGGVRKSLAMGGDLDVDDEFDGQFGLDDDTGNGQDGWDFGTARRSIVKELVQPTWEQSADATEDLLRTIRPTGQSQGVERANETSTSLTSPLSSTSGSRYEHPLMKLFDDQKTINATTSPYSPGHAANDPSLFRPNGYHAVNGSINSEPTTPMLESVSIEMPALNATSLTSASAISLPALPVNHAISASRSNQIELPSIYSPRDRNALGLTPSRQNSFDHFGGHAMRPNNNTPVSQQSMFDSRSNTGSEDSSTPTQNTFKASMSSPPKASSRPLTPSKSRGSSPTRIPIPAVLSPPSSPSRMLNSTAANSISNSSLSSMVPKTGFNASLGSHLHLNGSTQSLPDILPRPTISNASRERSTSSSAVPQIPKHLRKPSNLVLQLPQLDSPDSTCLPPSPSRIPAMGSSISSGPSPYAPTPLIQQTNAHESSSTKISSNKAFTDLPPMATLDMEVLTNNDDEAVVNELFRVVGETLRQLVHIEDALTSMSAG